MALRHLCTTTRWLSRVSNCGFWKRPSSRQFSEYVAKKYGSPQGISVDLLLEVLVIQLCNILIVIKVLYAGSEEGRVVV